MSHAPPPLKPQPLQASSVSCAPSQVQVPVKATCEVQTSFIWLKDIPLRVPEWRAVKQDCETQTFCTWVPLNESQPTMPFFSQVYFMYVTFGAW